MVDRHIRVRPNLDQLKHQAKDLLHAIRQGDPDAQGDRLAPVAMVLETYCRGCVVAQPIRLRNHDDFAWLLLDHGAAPNVRASLRKLMRFVGDELEREHLDVTPLAWGQRFHEQDFVSRPAMRLIAERGGEMS